LAPSLIETKRRVEREKVKDILRGWVEEWRRKGCENRMKEGEGEGERRTDVRRLVKRFARGNGGEGERLWLDKGVEKRREEPTRAKVLGLRRFWEKVGRDGLTA